MPSEQPIVEQQIQAPAPMSAESRSVEAQQPVSFYSSLDTSPVCLALPQYHITLHHMHQSHHPQLIHCVADFHPSDERRFGRGQDARRRVRIVQLLWVWVL